MTNKLQSNYHDALVYEEDAHLFEGPQWLNDRCINFYFRVLEHEEFLDRRDLLFMDPVVVSCMLIQCTNKEELEELGQGLGIATRSLIFIPVNDAEDFFSGCTHWSLLVYHPATQTFYHLDSSQCRNESAATMTARKFWMMCGHQGEPKFDDRAACCPQQTNGYDCGMYVLTVTKYLAHLFVTQEGKQSGGGLNMAGLMDHVTPDFVAEARRRIGNKMKAILK